MYRTTALIYDESTIKQISVYAGSVLCSARYHINNIGVWRVNMSGAATCVKRLRMERVAFVLTCALIGAVIAHIYAMDREMVWIVPLAVTGGMSLTYIVCKMFFGTVGIFDTFTEGNVPEWAEKGFSLKQYFLEFVIFIGCLIAASVLAGIYRLATG